MIRSFDCQLTISCVLVRMKSAELLLLISIEIFVGIKVQYNFTRHQFDSYLKHPNFRLAKQYNYHRIYNFVKYLIFTRPTMLFLTVSHPNTTNQYTIPPPGVNTRIASLFFCTECPSKPIL